MTLAVNDTMVTLNVLKCVCKREPSCTALVCRSRLYLTMNLCCKLHDESGSVLGNRAMRSYSTHSKDRHSFVPLKQPVILMYHLP